MWGHACLSTFTAPLPCMLAEMASKVAALLWHGTATVCSLSLLLHPQNPACMYEWPLVQQHDRGLDPVHVQIELEQASYMMPE